jgi:Fe-S cluster biogenesis protein NfuA
MDAAVIDEAEFEVRLAEAQAFVRNDGGDLTVKQLDRATGFVALKLELGDSACKDCIVEPDMLREIVREMLAGVPGARFIEIEDPRVSIQ